MVSRFSILLKALRQLGLTRVTLYALYKIGLKTGYYKRVESKEIETGYPLSTPSVLFS